MSNEEFDFDEWKELAEKNPAVFEKKRRDAIDRVVEQASGKHQKRLTRLQWRIDQERRRRKTPLGACIAISRMMFDSVYGEGGFVDALHGRTKEGKEKNAQVVSIGEYNKKR